MPKDPKSIPGAFQYGGFWFLTDRSVVQVPNVVSCPTTDFLKLARSDPRLPDLKGAPVASWLLARVSSMTRGRMPYSYDEVEGSDGNNFYIGFTCHQDDGSIIGSVMFFACGDHIRLHAKAVPPMLPERLRDAITKAVLASPHRVARSRVTVAWTDGASETARSSVPRVYGFEGERFLDEIAPQHAIDWSEYDSLS
ncbi:MAG: hypothetical protein ACYC67_02975 [Prosthecobacter sp.]